MWVWLDVASQLERLDDLMTDPGDNPTGSASPGLRLENPGREFRRLYSRFAWTLAAAVMVKVGAFFMDRNNQLIIDSISAVWFWGILAAAAVFGALMIGSYCLLASRVSIALATWVVMILGLAVLMGLVRFTTLHAMAPVAD